MSQNFDIQNSEYQRFLTSVSGSIAGGSAGLAHRWDPYKKYLVNSKPYSSSQIQIELPYTLQQQGMLAVPTTQTKLKKNQEEKDNSENDGRTMMAGISVNPTLWYTGVFQPENILIHVSQNFFNFFSSSMFWFILMALTQGTTKRKRRSVDEEDVLQLDEVVSEFNSVLVDGDNVAWFLRKMAETAEQYKRLKDEL
ncbi:uncharacterized protein LOC111704820 [Eurytemora carolleeae]|uniref:uncharacterized protein LOC111704820 n=1 Tax=Eurytemora carolleeae TaxID=1294199 RepID=UPI000C7941D9|nr:uncharacterized protein LOC111704820 [Eurytemora carolleeae]|eukprot:XP_023332941.1 uncharacterized protein LOC111704820 [Eurytemora affinis]